MNVTFYMVTDDTRVIRKNLGQPMLNVNAAVYSTCSIMTPSLLLDYHSNIVNSNYFYIPTWNRYYWITEVQAMAGGRCTVSGTEDVLMGNADEIMNIVAYRVRSEKQKTKLAVDNAYPSLITTNVNTIHFDKSPFSANNTFQYVMTVKGGSTSGS